jgi:hypothetical protein
VFRQCHNHCRHQCRRSVDLRTRGGATLLIAQLLSDPFLFGRLAHALPPTRSYGPGILLIDHEALALAVI